MMKILKAFNAGVNGAKIPIVAFFTAAAYYFLYFNDGSALEAQIAAVNAEYGAIMVKKTELEATIKKEEEMRGNLLQLARNFNEVKSKIPNEFKDTEMSAIINKTAIAANVKIAVLSRLLNGSADGKIKGAGADLIDEVVFQIKLSGTFLQVLHFVEILSKDDKIIKVKNFTLEKNAGKPQEPVIKLDGEIIGYKQAPVVAGSAAGKK